MILPKKESVEEFIKSPDWEMSLKNMSLLYLLFSYSIRLVDETNELLAKHVFALGEMKRAWKVLTKAFDDYDKTYRKYMDESMKPLANSDFDTIEKWLDDQAEENKTYLVESYKYLRDTLNEFKQS